MERQTGGEFSYQANPRPRGPSKRLSISASALQYFLMAYHRALHYCWLGVDAELWPFEMRRAGRNQSVGAFVLMHDVFFSDAYLHVALLQLFCRMPSEFELQL